MILAALLIIILFLIYNTFCGDHHHFRMSRHSGSARGGQMHHAAPMPKPHVEAPMPKHMDHCQPQMQLPQPSLNCEENQVNGYVEEHHDKPYASDYSEYMVATGLESSVVDSHKAFTDDIELNTTGASAETVFSHDDSIVPKWGLRRTNDYIPINPNSKDVPSQTNEQLNQNSGTRKYGLF